MSDRDLAAQPNELGRLKQDLACPQDHFRSSLEDQESAAKELRDSEVRFWVLLETLAQGVIVVDTRGRIKLVNSAAERMFGYTRDEMLGQPVEMLLPGSLRHIHRQHRTEYFSQPQARPMGIGLDLSGQRRDGKVFPIEVSLSYSEFPGGLMAVALVSDLTARGAVEESSREVEAIVESPGGVSFSKDRDWVIVSWNRGAERIYGYAAEEVIGRSVSLLIPTDRPNELPEILKRFEKGEQILNFETLRLRKDGMYGLT